MLKRQLKSTNIFFPPGFQFLITRFERPLPPLDTDNMGEREGGFVGSLIKPNQVTQKIEIKNSLFPKSSCYHSALFDLFILASMMESVVNE